MIPQLSDLTEEEINLVYKAPILTSILISGADGVIDNREINAAINYTKKNAKKTRALLYDFYIEIAENVEERIAGVLQVYPDNYEERNKQIVEELTGLNSIFPKLNKAFAVVYFVSLKTIARKIARSSGGFLRIFGTISKEERAYLELPMINDPLKIF